MKSKGKFTLASDDFSPARAKKYRFKPNETVCTWPHEIIVGRQILKRAGLTPPENDTLREKMAGGAPRPIKFDELNLRKHGVEKFCAIRKGQHEGEVQWLALSGIVGTLAASSQPMSALGCQFNRSTQHRPSNLSADLWNAAIGGL
jgi:hypothetical protein